MKKNYNNNYNNNYYGGNKQQNYYQPKPKNEVNKVEKSEEEGFTGTPDTWFEDKEFFSKLAGGMDKKEEKDYYFNSYSSFYIHEEMIKDRIRTGSYKSAIENNAEVFKDKIVLDIGCGTGILSIFAAKAGAKHVYGIEFADIADYAKEIVKINKLQNKVTIIKSKVEEAVLPVEKVDIIISEWMGYFLIYESMLDTVLYARDKWLNPDGYILPDRATMTVAAIEDSNYKKSKLNFWDDIYGINMSCMKPSVMSEPLIDVCEKAAINSSHCKIFEIDLYTVQKADLDFASNYELTFFRNDTVHGLISWFDIYFDKLPNKVEFTTSPYNKSTHWKQVIFYTDFDLFVEKGEILKGSVAVRKSNTNFREIDVKFSFHIQGRYAQKDWYQLFKIR